MIIELDKLPNASSLSINDDIVEVELEEVVTELKDVSGEILFLCRFDRSIDIVHGVVEKYEEVEPDADMLDQDIFARVGIRGRVISFSI